MFAMVLVIGIVVDDAIVVVENVEPLKELNNIVHDCQDLIADLKKYKTALGNLAGDLRSVKSRLDGIREKAVAARLDIEDEKIMEPKPPTVIELGPAMGKLKDPTVPFPFILSRNTRRQIGRAISRTRRLWSQNLLRLLSSVRLWAS